MRRLFPILLLLAGSLFAADADNSPEHLLAAGSVDAALQQLTAKTQAQPTDAESWHLMCKAYFFLEKWDQAITAGLKELG